MPHDVVELSFSALVPLSTPRGKPLENCLSARLVTVDTPTLPNPSLSYAFKVTRITDHLQAIRKKIESELARKRTISTPQRDARPRRPGKSNAQKGTVAALKPSPALTVPENITVAEASQLCAAKRTDCVLVVDDEEGLSGIFTAKDLAYRVSLLTLANLFVHTLNMLGPLL